MLKHSDVPPTVLAKYGLLRQQFMDDTVLQYAQSAVAAPAGSAPIDPGASDAAGDAAAPADEAPAGEAPGDAHSSGGAPGEAAPGGAAVPTAGPVTTAETGDAAGASPGTSWDSAGWGRAWDSSFQLSALEQAATPFKDVGKAVGSGEHSPEQDGEPLEAALPTDEGDGLVAVEGLLEEAPRAMPAPLQRHRSGAVALLILLLPPRRQRRVPRRQQRASRLQLARAHASVLLQQHH